MTKVRLSLSVSDSHINKFNEVAAAAEQAGMKVERRLNEIGVLTGVIDQDKIGRLRQVDGISDVEEERTVRIPPPDSPIQ
jgi:3-deoxy-D-manno-octulosonic-acid transferase